MSIFTTTHHTILVGLGGFEPPTSPLSGVRSNQLSYRPNFACLEFAWSALLLFDPSVVYFSTLPTSLITRLASQTLSCAKYTDLTTYPAQPDYLRLTGLLTLLTLCTFYRAFIAPLHPCNRDIPFILNIKKGGEAP